METATSFRVLVLMLMLGKAPPAQSSRVGRNTVAGALCPARGRGLKLPRQSVVN